MAIGWFIIPYARNTSDYKPSRRCRIEEFADDLRAVGAVWSYVEILGDHGICKVSAPPAALTQLNAVPGFTRIPKDRLDDSLSDLPANVKTALRSKIQSLGYTVQEIDDRFPGDLGSYTLRQVLLFAASRRLKPRYDSQSDAIVLDGPIQRCSPSIDQIDLKVR